MEKLDKFRTTKLRLRRTRMKQLANMEGSVSNLKVGRAWKVTTWKWT